MEKDYSYLMNIREDENVNNITYKSFYKECSSHALEWKNYDRKKCVLYYPRYKTSEGKNFIIMQINLLLIRQKDTLIILIIQVLIIFVQN